jgi:hypothetical protein
VLKLTYIDDDTNRVVWQEAREFTVDHAGQVLADDVDGVATSLAIFDGRALQGRTKLDGAGHRYFNFDLVPLQGARIESDDGEIEFSGLPNGDACRYFGLIRSSGCLSVVTPEVFTRAQLVENDEAEWIVADRPSGATAEELVFYLSKAAVVVKPGPRLRISPLAERTR